MTLFILETDPKYKNEEWINYLTNGDKIYDTCDLVTRPENTTVLTTCVEQIGSHCGKEVIDGIINEEDGGNSTTKEDWKYPDHVPECISSHLTTCRIDGYDALYADFQFASYILKKARLLQDMSIFRTYHPKLMEHSPIF
ncbi:hypothetical protein QL285_078856 [Trifolium repens]|nr:hypothetical protein QL285_078856 [Trifolium repens]